MAHNVHAVVCKSTGHVAITVAIVIMKTMMIIIQIIGHRMTKIRNIFLETKRKTQKKKVEFKFVVENVQTISLKGAGKLVVYCNYILPL